MKINTATPPFFEVLIKDLAKKLNFDLTYIEAKKEKESQDYDALSFELNHNHYLYRRAKRTPKKVGYFVTTWKRVGTGPILPFEFKDPFDFFLIAVSDQNDLGYFLFSKELLMEKGILSKHQKGGKRGFRVYPPWIKANNNQAIKTQKWQINYFTHI